MHYISPHHITIHVNIIFSGGIRDVSFSGTLLNFFQHSYLCDPDQSTFIIADFTIGYSILPHKV